MASLGRCVGVIVFGAMSGVEGLRGGPTGGEVNRRCILGPEPLVPHRRWVVVMLHEAVCESQ